MDHAESHGEEVQGIAAQPRKPLSSLWLFLIAAFWVYSVYWVGSIAYWVMPNHALVGDLLYRVVCCVLVAGGFAIMIRVAEDPEAPIPATLGLPLDDAPGRQFAVGFAIGGGLMTLDVATVAIFGHLQFRFVFGVHMLVHFAVVFVLLVFGALLEELSFRGYPFRKLVEAVGPIWAVVVLSVLFGAVHLSNPNHGGAFSWAFVNTVAVGILFAVAYLRSKALWLPFGLHFSWNLFQGAVFGLPVSGLHDFRSFVRGVSQGSSALTGGAYGPEDSAICTIVLVLGFPLVLFLTKRRNTPENMPGSLSGQQSI